MTTCQLCSFSFPRSTSTTCLKCRARTPGLSTSELRALNDKPQCAGCGLLSDRIPGGICNGCINFYKDQSTIPREIVCAPGAAKLFTRGPNNPDSRSQESEREDVGLRATNATALDVLTRSAIYRAQASDTRLNLGPPRVTASASTVKPAISKSLQITHERRQKRAEAKLQDEGKGVTIMASLWTYDEKGKLCEVRPGVHIRWTFNKEDQIKPCLDKLLERAKADFQIVNPQNAEQLTWGNVRLLADLGGVNEWASLSHLDQNDTIQYMFHEFQKQKYASDSLLRTSTIKIRFAIIGFENSSDTLHSTQSRSLVTTSAKKSLKRPRANTTADTDATPATRVVLKSAFRPRKSAAMPPPPAPKWTRNLMMREYKFTRVITSVEPNHGIVKLTPSTNEEVIEIATDWQRGERASKQGMPFGDTGYIGCGATKRAIYARFNGKEYAFTQNFDDETPKYDVQRNLWGEYELLAMCHWFKEQFDIFAKENNVSNIPYFYFNFPGSLLGDIQPLASGGCHVPFHAFIATPLLPCGPVDAKVRKFTGNDLFGKASDDITKAVHAFVHYSYEFSGKTILFCDMQGTLDAKGKMCLFDPQAHTDWAANDRHYWDLGPAHLNRLIEQHYKVCSENWVCKKLSLSGLTFSVKKLNSLSTEPDPRKVINLDDSMSSGSSEEQPQGSEFLRHQKPRRRNPMKVAAILNK